MTIDDFTKKSEPLTEEVHKQGDRLFICFFSVEDDKFSGAHINLDGGDLMIVIMKAAQKAVELGMPKQGIIAMIEGEVK